METKILNKAKITLNSLENSISPYRRLRNKEKTNLTQIYKEISRDESFFCFNCNQPFNAQNKASCLMLNNRHLCLECFPSNTLTSVDYQNVIESYASSSAINAKINYFYSNLALEAEKYTEEPTKYLNSYENQKVISLLKELNLETFAYLQVNGLLQVLTKDGFFTVPGVVAVDCNEDTLVYANEQGVVVSLCGLTFESNILYSSESPIIKLKVGGEFTFLLLASNEIVRITTEPSKKKKILKNVFDLLAVSNKDLLLQTEEEIALFSVRLRKIHSVPFKEPVYSACLVKKGFFLLNSTEKLSFTDSSSKETVFLDWNLSSIVKTNNLLIGTDDNKIYEVSQKDLKIQELTQITTSNCSLLALSTGILIVSDEPSAIWMTKSEIKLVTLIPFNSLVSSIVGY